MIIKSYEIEKKISTLLKYNLFLLYGENNGLKKDIRKIINFNLKKKKSNIELLSTYEEDILENKENFYNSIYSGSLFSDQKIITINNGTDKITSLIEDILNKKNENVLLIIFSQILEKKSKLRNLFEKETNTICVPCYLDNERDLQNIAQFELQKSNIMISREAINLLIEKSNQDRESIKNEIEKIKSYSYEKKKINLDEIKSIINFSGEHKSDVLINECLCGNISQFKKITSQLYLNSINQIFLLRILSNKIERLIKMKEFEKDYKNIDNLVNEIKPAIFWKEKPVIKKQLSLWNFIELKKVFNEISNIEFLCKKNPQLSTILSFNFFNGICKKANNFSSQYQ
tara:strand:- start:1010 stop:2041 length:1032 start_codon:yes stop_codon:yes gene_type:complete